MAYVEQTTKVGYLPIRGIITGASYHSHYLHKFFKDPEIKAILLQIDSPGGAAGASEAIAIEIARYQKEYPKKNCSLLYQYLHFRCLLYCRSY